MPRLKRVMIVFVLLVVGTAVGVRLKSLWSGPGVQASIPQKPMAQKSSDLSKYRDAYFPGTETLDADEMRVTACGTGEPTARPRQAAACFLVELGNGDKFLFDLGNGSTERISALAIPYDYLDKVFIGHLHNDHMGDLPHLWIGGALAGRTKPLRVWGPSGQTPSLGTAYAIEHLQQYLTWDLAGRRGNVPMQGYAFEVHEFDYRGVNTPIYQANGVTVRSIPAVHSIDGSVSFILEWNSLKFVFSSDSYPNTWFAQYAAGADIVIHECFLSSNLLIKKMNAAPQEALQVGSQVHTAPEAFGKLMSIVKPRLAVAYHFYIDVDTQEEMYQRVRSTYAYPQPLSVADDFMVWNITKTQIRTRRAVIDENIFPPDPINRVGGANPNDIIPFSPFIAAGRLAAVCPEICGVYKEINTAYGTAYSPQTCSCK